MGGDAGEIIVDGLREVAGSHVVFENVSEKTRNKLQRILAKGTYKITSADFEYMQKCILAAYKKLRS